jgi:hypothetical protein
VRALHLGQGYSNRLALPVRGAIDRDGD